MLSSRSAVVESEEWCVTDDKVVRGGSLVWHSFSFTTLKFIEDYSYIRSFILQNEVWSNLVRYP